MCLKCRRILNRAKLNKELECYKDCKILASQSQWCNGQLTTSEPTSLVQQSAEKFITTNCAVIPEFYFNFIKNICERHNLIFSVIVQEFIEIDEDNFLENYFTQDLPFSEFYSPSGFARNYCYIHTKPYITYKVSGPLTLPQFKVYSFLSERNQEIEYLSEDDD